MSIDIDGMETLAMVRAYVSPDAILALIARLREAETREQALAAHVEALQEKQIAKTCACSHDSATDVCLGHSPILESVRAERDALAAELTEARRQLAMMRGA